MLALRPVDFLGREAHAVAFLQGLVSRRGLPVDADQIAARIAAVDLLREQLGHRGAVRDLQMVGEAATVAVDEEDFHWARTPGVKRMEREVKVAEVKLDQTGHSA